MHRSKPIDSYIQISQPRRLRTYRIHRPNTIAMSSHNYFVPGTAGNLEAFLEAVDEAIVKHGYDKKAMRNWLGSPAYRQYLHVKATEICNSASSHQVLGPDLAMKDEGIATLADIERFRADFERRLEKLEAKALGRSPSAYSAENPVPECPAERQKPLDALSKAPVIGSESGEGSHGSHGSDDSDDYDSNDSSDNEPEEDCVHGRGHDVYCGGCMASRDDSDG